MSKEAIRLKSELAHTRKVIADKFRQSHNSRAQRERELNETFAPVTKSIAKMIGRKNTGNKKPKARNGQNDGDNTHASNSNRNMPAIDNHNDNDFSSLESNTHDQIHLDDEDDEEWDDDRGDDVEMLDVPQRAIKRIQHLVAADDTVSKNKRPKNRREKTTKPLNETERRLEIKRLYDKNMITTERVRERARDKRASDRPYKQAYDEEKSKTKHASQRTREQNYRRNLNESDGEEIQQQKSDDDDFDVDLYVRDRPYKPAYDEKKSRAKRTLQKKADRQRERDARYRRNLKERKKGKRLYISPQDFDSASGVYIGNLAPKRKKVEVSADRIVQEIVSKPKKQKAVGKSLEAAFIPYNQNIVYEYYDDPNELCDRLQLLVSSQNAGNSNHSQEINSIIEELRERNIIV